MKIAVIGAGPRATGICQLLTVGGYDVTRAGLEDGAAYDASTGSEVVIFAGPRSEMDAMIAKVGRILPETIVVDAMEGKHRPMARAGPNCWPSAWIRAASSAPPSSARSPTPTFCWRATIKTR